MLRGGLGVVLGLLCGCGQSGDVAPPNRAPMECGAQPCCGDPPRPCSEVLARPDATAGFIAIEQLPGPSCEVQLDGRPWPGAVALRARIAVPPGPHVVTCRTAAGVALERRLTVETGRETPLYWGP